MASTPPILQTRHLVKLANQRAKNKKKLVMQYSIHQAATEGNVGKPGIATFPGVKLSTCKTSPEKSNYCKCSGRVSSTLQHSAAAVSLLDRQTKQLNHRLCWPLQLKMKNGRGDTKRRRSAHVFWKKTVSSCSWTSEPHSRRPQASGKAQLVLCTRVSATCSCYTLCVCAWMSVSFVHLSACFCYFSLNWLEKFPAISLAWCWWVAIFQGWLMRQVGWTLLKSVPCWWLTMMLTLYEWLHRRK